MFQIAEPILLGNNQTLIIGKGLVKLVMIGEFEFGKDLAYSIGVIGRRPLFVRRIPIVTTMGFICSIKTNVGFFTGVSLPSSCRQVV